MIPQQLQLKNFLCYRGELPVLTFDGLHVACLSGDNGAGKSSLLDAITWALWGKARLNKDEDLITQNESEMLVEFMFRLREQEYRVIRRYKRGSTAKASGKSQLDFQAKNNGAWRSLTDGTLSETQQSINSTLHMNYETFTNASFIMQGKADEFTSRTPAERKQVLADILDLGVYSMLEERAKDRSRTLNEQMHNLEGLLSHLAELSDKRDTYAVMAEEADARLAQTLLAVQTSEQSAQTSANEIRLLDQHNNRRAQVQADLTRLRKDHTSLAEQLSQQREAIAHAEAILTQRDEIKAGVLALRGYEAERDRLDGLRPQYDALREQETELRAEFSVIRSGLRAELKQHSENVERWEKVWNRRDEITAAYEEAKRHKEEQQGDTDALKTLRERLELVTTQLSEIGTALTQYAGLHRDLRKERENLHLRITDLTRLIENTEHQMERREKASADLKLAVAAQAELVLIEANLAELRMQDQALFERKSEEEAQRRQIKAQADALKQSYELLSTNDVHDCPMCGTVLGDEGRQRIEEHQQHELRLLRDAYSTSTSTIKELEAERETLLSTITSVEERYTQIKQTADRAHLYEEIVTQSENQQREKTRLQKEIAQIEQNLAKNTYGQETREKLDHIEATLAGFGIDLDELRAEKTFESNPLITRYTAHLKQEQTELKERQRTLEKSADARAELERKLIILEREHAELATIAQTLPQAQAEIERIEGLLERNEDAPEIRAKGRAVQAAIEKLGYSKDLYDAAKAAIEQYRGWDERERQLQSAQERIEHSQQLLAQIEKNLAHMGKEIERLVEEDGQLAIALRDEVLIRQRARTLETTLQTQRREHDFARNDAAEKQHNLRSATEAAEQYARRKREQQALTERHGLFKELGDAFGKRGVQAMLIESAVPEVEHEANRLLRQMTDNRMQLTIDTQKATKKGDPAETLDINVSDVLGQRPYDAFSGGEAVRINFALRIALSRMLARRAGASLEMLVIDEGCGALDAEGRERFIEAITSIQRDFRCILVVTHLDDIKDRFPVRIEVRKETSGSRWEFL